MLTVVCVAALLPACSKSLSGSTSCSTFRGLSSSDQFTAIANMQKKRGDSTSTALAVASVDAFCTFNPGRRIDGAYTG